MKMLSFLVKAIVVLVAIIISLSAITDQNPADLAASILNQIRNGQKMSRPAQSTMDRKAEKEEEGSGHLPNSASQALPELPKPSGEMRKDRIEELPLDTEMAQVEKELFEEETVPEKALPDSTPGIPENPVRADPDTITASQALKILKTLKD